MTTESSSLDDQRNARLDLALAATSEASKLILSHYQSSDLQVDSKRDASPVTVADRGAEQLLRERIQSAYPDDGILGEEFGEIPSSNGWRWILDPIDGTKSFIHGVPLFGTLVGIEREGACEVGVCRFPALDEVVYAAIGGGAWWKSGTGAARAARVSGIDSLDEACFCTTTISGWTKIGRRETFEELMNVSKLTRGWGDCYGHILVATGRAELMVDPELNAWDAAALVPIVQEAGGRFVAWNGEVSIENGNGMSINAELCERVLAVLASK